MTQPFQPFREYGPINPGQPRPRAPFNPNQPVQQPRPQPSLPPMQPPPLAPFNPNQPVQQPRPQPSLPPMQPPPMQPLPYPIPYPPTYIPPYTPPYTPQPSPPHSTYAGCIQKWANVNLRDGRTLDVFVTSIDERSLGGFLPSGQQVAIDLDEITFMTC